MEERPQPPDKLTERQLAAEERDDGQRACAVVVGTMVPIGADRHESGDISRSRRSARSRSRASTWSAMGTAVDLMGGFIFLRRSSRAGSAERADVRRVSRRARPVGPIPARSTRPAAASPAADSRLPLAEDGQPAFASMRTWSAPQHNGEKVRAARSTSRSAARQRAGSTCSTSTCVRRARPPAEAMQVAAAVMPRLAGRALPRSSCCGSTNATSSRSSTPGSSARSTTPGTTCWSRASPPSAHGELRRPEHYAPLTEGRQRRCLGHCRLQELADTTARRRDRLTRRCASSSGSEAAPPSTTPIARSAPPLELLRQDRPERELPQAPRRDPQVVGPARRRHLRSHGQPRRRIGASHGGRAESSVPACEWTGSRIVFDGGEARSSSRESPRPAAVRGAARVTQAEGSRVGCATIGGGAEHDPGSTRQPDGGSTSSRGRDWPSRAPARSTPPRRAGPRGGWGPAHDTRRGRPRRSIGQHSPSTPPSRTFLARHRELAAN